MKIRVASLLTLVVLVGAFLSYTQSASSSSSNRPIGVVLKTSNLILPLTTTLTVDRTDDTAAATACTGAPNDCSLRGAIIAANALKMVQLPLMTGRSTQSWEVVLSGTARPVHHEVAV